MKLSSSFWQTYKEVPSDAEITSHQLLIRAGLICKNAGGIYSYLPMMVRSLRKIENIIREELEKIGAQEVVLSVVTPGELWRETKRWDKMEGLMLKFKDRSDRDLCISPTNEEAITDVFRKTVRSYKSLPVNLYQINTKFRDEIRPRFGLMRGREFVMKDAYSFHVDKKSLDEVYEKYFDAYVQIFKRMGLEFIVVQADGGAMAQGDAKTHEFQVVADAGEDLVVVAEQIDYAANREKAVSYPRPINNTLDNNFVEVSTPGRKTITEVAAFLNLDPKLALKSLLYEGLFGQESRVIMAILLGDDELNEIKLQSYCGADKIRPLELKKLNDLGFIQGFIGPLNNEQKMTVILDSSIDEAGPYIVGANKKDTHIQGFVPKRDLQRYDRAHLRLAKEGDLGPDKKSEISFKRGIEVGHIFQLGDQYSSKMKANVLGQDGKEFSPLMGCYGIGVTRTLQAAIEQSHDENGIIWPAAIAPYQLYFIAICKSEKYQQLAQSIYDECLGAGIEVLFDDRPGGPGVKFKDADLLGLPLRLVLGERDFEKNQELELKLRGTGEVIKLKKEQVVEQIKQYLSKCR